jgi:HK97 family phage prohead protease
MEKRHATNQRVEIRREENQPATISGYAAVFYRADQPGTEFRLADDYVERIQPGAFDNALKNADDARALFNHDSNQVLGRVSSGTLRLNVDEVGLRYQIDLPDTQLGRDVATIIERGDVSGSSFAFAVNDKGSEVTRDGEQMVRTITDVSLFDVGPVTYPAYQATSTAKRNTEALEELEAYRTANQAAVDAVNVRSRLIELGIN